MIGWLRTLILYRLLGGRAILALTALGWLWRRVRGEGSASRDANRRASVSRGRLGR